MELTTIKSICTKNFEVYLLQTPTGKYQIRFGSVVGKVKTTETLEDYYLASSVFDIILAGLEGT